MNNFLISEKILNIVRGRNRGGIMTVLEVLAKEEYIEWKRSDPDTMTILEAWERKEPGRWQAK